MIGTKITNDKGEILDQYKSLSKSQYNPPQEVKDLFARVQKDYQIAYSLQHRAFDEFDGVSLLDRARLDQQTFAAYVGAEYLPQHKKWRWRGRKNTARNKLISILASMLAGMLFPYVSARNEQNEEDKMTARIMRIMVEDKLKKANYEIKFLFIVLSALVNPATFVGLEYVEAMQRIKTKLADGSYKVSEVIDEMLSGLHLNILPIDEIMLPDFYSGTGMLQVLPNLIRVRRISYDQARAEFKGKFFYDGKDLFDFVESGKTKVLVQGQDQQTLMDIDWTEADQNYVQVLTIQYKPEDLELTWVGGVGMFEYNNPVMSNPMKHRRFVISNGEWVSVPIYPYAMSGFEPIDPTGRFAYFKSAAFKEFWDDKALNTMHRLVLDGTYLDVIKPIFLSGVSNINSSVLVPGATIGMPTGASATPYALGPNLAAAYNAISKQEQDMSESTQDRLMGGNLTPDVTATQSAIATQQAKINLGVFASIIANLIKQIGELTMDCVIQYETIGELDASIPESLSMKYKTFLIRGKDKGKDITNKIYFTDKYMGQKFTKEQVDKIDWSLYHKTGKTNEEKYSSDQRMYEVNPYQFARHIYTMWVDVEQMLQKSGGNARNEKLVAFNMLTDPRVLPFTDAKQVVEDFVIEEFGGDDPDKYKNKEGEMLNQIMQPPGQLTGSMGNINNGAKPLVPNV